MLSEAVKEVMLTVRDDDVDGMVKVETEGAVVSGGSAGITAFDAADAFPVPTLFVAVTVNVYEVPLVRPVTVIGEALPVPV